MTLPLHHFRVTDAEGIWGDMRQRAKTRRQAARKVRTYLRAEVEPNGSLLPVFRLSPVPPKPRR